MKNQLKCSIEKMALGLVLLMGFISAACTKKTEEAVITLGLNPAENVDVVDRNGKALVDYVYRKTGLRLKTYVSNDYGGLIEAMRSGKIDISFLPSFSLIQAEKVANAKILLKAVRFGRSTYHSVIFTAKDYKSIQDLKGKTIAWTDPASGSGHILAKASLMDMGIDPDTFFSKQIFAGGHDAAILAVINKTVDAGATLSNDAEGKHGMWTMIRLKPEQYKEIKVLHVSKAVPSETLSTTKKFYEERGEDVKKLVEFFKNIHNDPEGKGLIGELYRIEQLIDAKTEEYEPLRAAAKQVNVNQ